MRIASLAGPLEIGVDYWRWAQTSKMDQALPRFFNPEFPHNVGDWFLTKIVDRLLDYDELVLVTRDATPEQWERVNSECQALVLRGGNFLEPGWLERNVGVEVARRCEIPVIIMGAGIQGAGPEGVPFTEADVQILRRFHERCAASALRGERSAEALAAVGITNTVVTGCPTLFWSRQPTLEVRRPSDHHAGFSFRQSLYSHDEGPYRAQFDAIERVRDRFGRTTVILQGEEVVLQRLHQVRTWGAEFLAVHGQDELGLQTMRREPLREEELLAQAHELYDRFARPELVGWLARSTFFSWDIAEYLEAYRSFGMVIGCRLHSNLLALSQGVPAFYLTYDDRTREMVDLFGIPSCPLGELGPAVDPLVADWSTVERRYAQQHAELHRFLELNGLPHRLGKG